MPSSDELNELIRAVAGGDRQAFALLFKHFAPRVKAYLARTGCNPALAEELTQESMALLWRKAAGFDPARAGLSTWLFTIARNLRVDHLRREGGALDSRQDERASDAEAETLADPGAGPDLQLDQDRRERGVRAALARLSGEQALIVRLSYFDEQPHASIARELGLPLGTVKSRIRLALAHLRRLLDEFEP